MKKIISLFILLACIIGLTSCKMKECKCYSTNVITQVDSIIQNEPDTVNNSSIVYSPTKVGRIISSETDTVNNNTHGSCEEFNKDEIIIMNSTTKVYHTILCKED